MQIFGTLKCRETKKCRLWFDERKIPYHFVDLTKRAISPGELDAIAAKHSWDELMDKTGKVWVKRQLEWKDYDAQEELLANPLLLKTPVVREGRDVVVGYNPELLQQLFSKDSAKDNAKRSGKSAGEGAIR